MKRFIPVISALLLAATVIAVIAASRKTITVITNGKPQKIVTYRSKLSEVLKANHIQLDQKDKIDPPVASTVTNKMVIRIKKAVHISVSMDHRILRLKSSEKNVKDLLVAEKIQLSSKDLLTPALSTPLQDGLKIKIVRVTSRIYTKTKSIAFDTVIKRTPELANTYHRIAYAGANGKRQYTIREIYHDNVLYTKSIIKKEIIQSPRSKIIVQGSYPVQPVSKNGKLLAYSRKLRVRATAYWAIRGIGRTFTGSGRMAVRNPEGYSTIAVDRHLFSYGTRLFIVGYGFAIAADTGSAIVGNTIDVYFNTRQEARRWAVKHPLVYVLK